MNFSVAEHHLPRAPRSTPHPPKRPPPRSSSPVDDFAPGNGRAGGLVEKQAMFGEHQQGFRQTQPMRDRTAGLDRLIDNALVPGAFLRVHATGTGAAARTRAAAPLAIPLAPLHQGLRGLPRPVQRFRRPFRSQQQRIASTATPEGESLDRHWLQPARTDARPLQHHRRSRATGMKPRRPGRPSQTQRFSGQVAKGNVFSQQTAQGCIG